MKKEKIIVILITILLLFLLIFQLNKAKTNLKKAETIKNQVNQLQQLNRNLELNYHKSLNNQNVIKKEQKESGFETLILAKLEEFNLAMIDFSSTETELNLNLNGDFHSILHFIYYLELSLVQLEIKNFKIKTDTNSLFFFIKIEKELV